MATTSDSSYTKRLVSLQMKSWKAVLDVQRPYRRNLLGLMPGRTLDVGCGIGRNLATLPPGSVGIDHNPHSIEIIRGAGMLGFSPADFQRSVEYKLAGFDSLLLSHVLEHMTYDEGSNLIKQYEPLVKSRGHAILMCPQERGYRSDDSHVTFLDAAALAEMLMDAGFTLEKSYSFPFPRALGKLFTYNEFVVVGRKA